MSFPLKQYKAMLKQISDCAFTAITNELLFLDAVSLKMFPSAKKTSVLVELISYLSSSPPPRFSRDPESGVEVLLTVPMLSTMLPLDMFSEEPELQKNTLPIFHTSLSTLIPVQRKHLVGSLRFYKDEKTSWSLDFLSKKCQKFSFVEL